MEDYTPLFVPGSNETTPETGLSDAVCEDAVRQDVKHDIVVAILRAFAIVEEIGGSQKTMLDIVTYGKHLYCKGDLDM